MATDGGECQRRFGIRQEKGEDIFPKLKGSIRQDRAFPKIERIHAQQTSNPHNKLATHTTKMREQKVGSVTVFTGSLPKLSG